MEADKETCKLNVTKSPLAARQMNQNGRTQELRKGNLNRAGKTLSLASKTYTNSPLRVEYIEHYA